MLGSLKGGAGILTGLMKDAPIKLKVMVALLIVLAIAAEAFVSDMAKAGRPQYGAVVAAVLALVFLVVAVILLIGQEWGESLWSVTVPRLLSQEAGTSLASKLTSIRDKAYTFLKQSNTGLDYDLVRANVFVPDYVTVKDKNRKGIAYLLTIPGPLGTILTDKERELEFYPGQGATGLAFASGSPSMKLYRIFLPDQNGAWPIEQELTDTQKSKLHPNLKWIVSFPLGGDLGNPQAVLNIDGLDTGGAFNWPDNQLRQRLGMMADNIVSDVVEFQKELLKQPKVTIHAFLR